MCYTYLYEACSLLPLTYYLFANDLSLLIELYAKIIYRCLYGLQFTFIQFRIVY